MGTPFRLLDTMEFGDQQSMRKAVDRMQGLFRVNVSMSDLSTFHLQAMDRLYSSFNETGDGIATVEKRSAAVDEIVSGMFMQAFPGAEQQGVCVLAVGGYGRRQLFPHSDVDLLFLFGREGDAKRCGDDLAVLLTKLWDAQLRVSQSVRTPAECSRLASDNHELHISLLDARFLAGDRSLYLEFAGRVLPKFFIREQKSLMRALVEAAEERHKEFGRTIYHLEPDVKEAPGGLRDFQLACWISQIAHVQPDQVPLGETKLPADVTDAVAEGKRFLFALRCYLHYFAGRDSNRLDFDLQATIAHDGAGKAFDAAPDAAEWMRDYYRHVRVINRLALRMIEEYATPKNSLLAVIRQGRSKLSNRDFSVANGRVFLRYSHALEVQPEVAIDLFRFVARHGMPLAARTERLVAQNLDAMSHSFGDGKPLWPALADILRQPHAYQALAVMRETGALYTLFPELAQIDCLVVRDFYHRYTVDEHTFVAIRILKRLDDQQDKLSKQFAELAKEVRRPELLYFALLFHDVGKGVADESHVEASVESAGVAMERIEIPDNDRLLITFLIEHHLTMSNFITKRDIADPETVEEFARIVGTTENLRALALVTYADTSAVNPHAMTAWRKQLLWQLYMATHNRLTGDAEDRRIDEGLPGPVLDAAPRADRESLKSFLAGFPERYLRTHSVAEVLGHHELSKELSRKEAAVRITRRDSLYDVEVIAHDRPFLFSSLCAVMAGFGLNIERAEAFANKQRLVLDSFSVTVSERRGGVELDDHDLRQVVRSLKKVIEGKEDPNEILDRRGRVYGARRRAMVDPEVTFDNETSSRATIFHITAEDRTGLLFDLTSAFSRTGCDIEVVLIETQGRKAIDVFYVTGPSGKLNERACFELRDELLGVCRAKAA